MSQAEVYEFEIPDDGLDYDILDISYNPTTKAALQKCNIAKDATVLDVGSGSGHMTSWMATELVPNGKVISIDNSESQQSFAKKTISTKNIQNVEFKLM